MFTIYMDDHRPDRIVIDNGTSLELYVCESNLDRDPLGTEPSNEEDIAAEVLLHRRWRRVRADGSPCDARKMALEWINEFDEENPKPGDRTRPWWFTEDRLRKP